MLYNLKLIPEIRDKITNWQSNYKLCTGKHIEKRSIIKLAVSMYINNPVNIVDLLDFLAFYAAGKKFNTVYLTREDIKVDKIKEISIKMFLNHKIEVSQNDLLNFYINKFINNFKPTKIK